MKINLAEVFGLLYSNPAIAKSQASNRVRGCKDNGYMVETDEAKEVLEKITSVKSASKQEVKDKALEVLKDLNKYALKFNQPTLEQPKMSPFQAEDFLRQFMTIAESGAEAEDMLDQLLGLYDKIKLVLKPTV